MLKKEIFKIPKFKIQNPRYSKPAQEIENDIEEVRLRSKTKTNFKKTLLSNIDLTKQDLYDFFRKAPSLRTNQEIEIFGDYLSQHFQYFKKLKNEDSQLKVEKITKICRLEKAFKGEPIINYGEEGDKFYIVLEGIVEIYKPVYIEVELLPNEFINLLNRIKEREGNSLKYERIKEKNNIFFETYSGRSKQGDINYKNSQSNNPSNRSGVSGSIYSASSKSDMEKLKYKQTFLVEDEEKMGEYGEGFSFGDIALIKKTVRNATIKAKEYCILLTIEKNDYNKAILEFQRKKLSKEIDDFIRVYSFFKDFSHDRIIRLFNCFSKKTIYKGENLYEQNKKDECLYIINNGTFLVSCNISFFWLEEYISYISYEGKNILEFLIQNKALKYIELINIIKKCYSKLSDNDLPINFDKYDLWEKVSERKRKDNLFRIKKDEEKLNDPDNLYNLDIKKINYDEILGIEEVFDFKKRFCTCKCLSDKADIRFINIYDFLKLIINLGENELKYLLKMINERKKLLKNQIIKAIKNEERKIMFNLDIRYENLLNEAEHRKITKEKRKNQIFSTIKMKGYKYSLHDILDNNIPLIESDNNRKSQETTIKIKKTKKQKSTEALLKSLYSKRKDNNRVKLKIIKNILNKRNINSINKENSQINPILSMQNSATTFSKYPFYKKINYTRNSGKNINFSNTGESFFAKFKKRKASNYSMDKNAKTTKYSFEKTASKINFEISKTIDNSPNIQNIKEHTKLNILKNEIFENKKEQNSNLKNKGAYENINLPNLFKKKKMRRTNSDFKPLLTKTKNSYKEFYNFYNKDKNFFASPEFQNQLKNEFNYYKKKSIFENDKSNKK